MGGASTREGERGADAEEEGAVRKLLIKASTDSSSGENENGRTKLKVEMEALARWE
jgi:hypothetical protein